MVAEETSYLRWLVFWIAAILAGLAGFNALVDPYGQFELPRAQGLTQRALGFNHRAPLAKSLVIGRLHPSSIILGNSRAETGYEPAGTSFASQPAYNLALGGTSMRDARRFFLEALATGQLRHVVLALDLTMFDPSANDLEIIPDAVLLTDSSGMLRGPWAKWRRTSATLLSADATSDSLWSLTHQNSPVAAYLPSGRRDESADTEQVLRQGGPRAFSRGVEATFLAASLRDMARDEFRAYAAALRQLQEILSLAAKNEIRLTLMTNPIHARYTYMLAAGGLWPMYEKWKWDLVQIASNSQRPDLVTLWDFSGVSQCTGESMPRAGDANMSMRWWRESSHFQKALGDIVLAWALAGKESPDCLNLGQRLDPASLKETLDSQRAALRRWIRNSPDDVAEINAMAAQHRRGGFGAVAFD